MAGLLIKELKLREAIERVLMLCPAPLTLQWQDEMLRWFGESCDSIFAAVDQQRLTNPWQRSTQVIASSDYAKQDDVRKRVWQQRWDLVVIDEAHKGSAYTKSSAGRSAEVAETKRYQLATQLSEMVDHVLPLTVTPHHGDEDWLARFLRLVDPDLFPEPHRLMSEAGTIRREALQLGKGARGVCGVSKKTFAICTASGCCPIAMRGPSPSGSTARSTPSTRRPRPTSTSSFPSKRDSAARLPRSPAPCSSAVW